MSLQGGHRQQVFKNVELAKILNDLRAKQTQEEASKKLQQYLAQQYPPKQPPPEQWYSLQEYRPHYLHHPQQDRPRYYDDASRQVMIGATNYMA